MKNNSTHLISGTYASLLLCIATALLLPSCEKQPDPFKGEYELSGRVIDDISGKPIPNATVGVLEYDRDDFSGWGAKTAVSVLADDKGAFSFRFNADEAKYYYELVAQEPYKYFDILDYPRIEFNSKGKSTMDILLNPKGYLTYIIKGNKGGWKLHINGTYTDCMYGDDTLITVLKRPISKRSFTYWVYDINDEVILKKSDTVFIPPPPDTAFYLIEF